VRFAQACKPEMHFSHPHTFNENQGILFRPAKRLARAQNQRIQEIYLPKPYPKP
jgi:hypothetical protein